MFGIKRLNKSFSQRNKVKNQEDERMHLNLGLIGRTHRKWLILSIGFGTSRAQLFERMSFCVRLLTINEYSRKLSEILLVIIHLYNSRAIPLK